MFAWLKEKLSHLVDEIWTPFNRDTLRNLCLPYVHCTYDPEKVKKGEVFCHVDDRTQRRWLRIGAALVVTKVLAPKTYEVTTRYNAKDPYGKDPVPLTLVVQTLNDEPFKAGEYFTAYGQYVYTGVIVGKPRVHQVNHVNAHVFKEPFIDFGYGER